MELHNAYYHVDNLSLCPKVDRTSGFRSKQNGKLQGRKKFLFSQDDNLWLTNGRRYPFQRIIYIKNIPRLSLVAVITRINDKPIRARD